MTKENLERLIFREFLLEPGLLSELGLDRVPDRLIDLLGPSASVTTLLSNQLLDDLSIKQLREIFVIRDMTFISRTAADLAAELKEPEVPYDRCCRLAICYAVISSQGHIYSALRAAATKNDKWARHHYLYGLILGLDGEDDRARWELGLALQYEPYEEGRVSIRLALDILDGR